jgi:outer membrane protein TolC
MARRVSVLVIQLSILPLYGQQAPSLPDKPWPVERDPRFQAELAQIPASSRPALDPDHPYTLSELVDIAEHNNPDTRVAWEQAKQRAAAVGVTRSALLPTIGALASASINQYSLFVTRFYHIDLATFPAALNLSYTLFDFGTRNAKIDQAKANLLAADFAFNDTHRRIVFQVAQAYYRLLDAMKQEDAARAILTDAQTVQQAVESRLANGLATLPDVLEARAASAQAQYELASIQGLEEISRGALATVIGVALDAMFRVEDVSNTALPEGIEEPVREVMNRALSQRPDLLAQVARIRSADEQIKQAHSAFYPVLSVSGDWGHRNSYGSQNFNPTIASHIYPYTAQLSLSWTLFDGGMRRTELQRTESARREAQAQANLSRAQIENEIWTAYSNLKTAQSRQEAANALLQAAEQSYNAATEAFQAGVRTFIEVTTAQRELARARSAQASARVQVLTSLADLAFRAGDSIPQTGPQTGR